MRPASRDPSAEQEEACSIWDLHCCGAAVPREVQGETEIKNRDKGRDRDRAAGSDGSEHWPSGLISVSPSFRPAPPTPCMTAVTAAEVSGVQCCSARPRLALTRVARTDESGGGKVQGSGCGVMMPGKDREAVSTPARQPSLTS